MPLNFNFPFVTSVFGVFLASAVIAYVYVWPAIRKIPRFNALRILAAVHAFRFEGMNFLVVGFVSPGLNADFAHQVAWGDLIAATLSLISITALALRWSIAIPIVWIFNIWGTLDLLNAYYMGSTKDPGLMGAGIYIPTIYVPILLVSHILIFIILLAKRPEEVNQ